MDLRELHEGEEDENEIKTHDMYGMPHIPPSYVTLVPEQVAKEYGGVPRMSRVRAIERIVRGANSNLLRTVQTTAIDALDLGTRVNRDSLLLGASLAYMVLQRREFENSESDPYKSREGAQARNPLLEISIRIAQGKLERVAGNSSEAKSQIDQIMARLYREVFEAIDPKRRGPNIRSMQEVYGGLDAQERVRDKIAAFASAPKGSHPMDPEYVWPIPASERSFGVQVIHTPSKIPSENGPVDTLLGI